MIHGAKRVDSCSTLERLLVSFYLFILGLNLRSNIPSNPLIISLGMGFFPKDSIVVGLRCRVMLGPHPGRRTALGEAKRRWQ